MGCPVYGCDYNAGDLCAVVGCPARSTRSEYPPPVLTKADARQPLARPTSGDRFKRLGDTGFIVGCEWLGMPGIVGGAA